MQRYIGTKLINAKSMNRQEYNDFRGWQLPDDEDGSDEGMLVEYVDGGKANTEEFNGYISWSPIDVFEKAYNCSGEMSFGDAIILAKSGCKVSRKGWNGETHAMFDGSVYKNHGVDECEILPHFDMYTVNSTGRRAMLPGWLASQSDIDALDWCVVS